MEAILGGLVAFAVVVGWTILRWQTKGRDPSYLDDASMLLAAPPDGMTAATATIVDGGPAPTAFMAALFDLASRDEIAFRDETPDAPGAHRVGIEIHGTPTDDPHVRLNRRRPVGEGEAWLLANLKGFAASNIAGPDKDAQAIAAMGAMSGLFGFVANELSAGSAGVAPGALVDGMSSGPVADPQELLIAALTRAGKPVPEELRASIAKRAPMMDLMREAMNDPAAISADPQAFAHRVEAATGRPMTDEEMGSLTTWLHEHQAALKLMGAERSGAEAYISADRAVAFHPPLGFATLVENYARRKGWVKGFSFVARWKWHGLAVAEVVGGLLVAGVAGQGLVYGVGLGVAAGGLASWFVAPYMASRTREGAVMKAELAAYRRTLKTTLDSSATLDDAVTAAGMAWLETPDQALVWGVALGLRPEIEALLRRTMSGMSAGTVSKTAFLPRWVSRATQAVMTAVPGMSMATAPPAAATSPTAPPETGAPTTSPTAVRDYAAVFAGIERIGTVTAPGAGYHG